jgi:hypothetical protein
MGKKKTCIFPLCDSPWPIDLENALKKLFRKATPKNWEEKRRQVLNVSPILLG